MKVISVLLALEVAVNVAARDIVCGPGITAKSVTVEKGESFTYQTQRGRNYRRDTECSVEYKAGDTCAKMSFICTKINIDNRDDKKCSQGDKLQVNGNGKSKVYCKKQKFRFVSADKISVVFTSDAQRHSTGATCKVACKSAAVPCAPSPELKNFSDRH